MSNQKIHASTQKFTEVVDIIGNVVFFENGNASLLIEVTASNFSLLSQKEQDSKIFAYASLLNSLSFPIQIIIKNRRMDITSYINNLEEQEKQTKNPLLAQHIKLYKNFVHEMIKVNVVLNKTFFVVISYNSLEAGVTGARQAIDKKGKVNPDFVESAKKSLEGKSISVHDQLRKLALAARTLEKEELIKLFYEIYNEGSIDPTQAAEDIKSIAVKKA